MRHYARAGSELVREAYEAEVGAEVEAAVRGELVERQRERSCCGGHAHLALAPAELCRHAVVVHGVEAEQAGRHLPVEGEGVAVSGGRTERVAVHDAVGGPEHVHVVYQRLGVCPEPEPERRGHGYLEVRVARKEHFRVPVAEFLEGAEQLQGLLAQRLELVPEEELDVDEHLVVARASGVYLLAGVPELAGQQQLNLRVDVLDIVLEAESPVFDAVRDPVESLVQLSELLPAQQPYAA